MMAVIVVGSIIMSLILGWWITVVMTTALTSWSQEWMQRKVRYGQAEFAPALAGQLADEAEAHGDPPQNATSGPVY